jgi:phosphate transport system substrate-binding protein
MSTGRIMVTALLAASGVLLPAVDAVGGSMTIAGNGPEQHMMEQLARAFENRHLGSYVQIRWDLTSQPIDLVKSGEVDVAVTGHIDTGLTATPIAWDGIAVVVDFTNPVKAVMRQEVAAIFTRAVTRWSQLGGPDIEIHPIDRPSNQHIRQSFEELLGIVGQAPESTRVIQSDQRAISTVAGDVSSITYASLGVVRDAVTYGVGVNLLMIDQTEPAEQTVKDGRYRLRRPVLLLKRKEANLAADAFAEFALSPEGQAIVDEMFIPYVSTVSEDSEGDPAPRRRQ